MKEGMQEHETFILRYRYKYYIYILILCRNEVKNNKTIVEGFVV